MSRPKDYNNSYFMMYSTVNNASDLYGVFILLLSKLRQMESTSYESQTASTINTASVVDSKTPFAATTTTIVQVNLVKWLQSRSV